MRLTCVSPGVEVVSSPTGKWLERELAVCSSRFTVASPFVGYELRQMASAVCPGARTEVVTRTDIRSFAAGSSDLDVLCLLAADGTRIMALPGLHAKVYVIDSRVALVTSANATHGGLWRNLECGLAVREPLVVRRIRQELLSGLGTGQKPTTWSGRDLADLRPAVDALRRSLPPELRARLIAPEAMPEETQAVPADTVTSVSSALTGWTGLVYRAVCDLDNDEFTLEQMYSLCIPRAARQFPRNRYPDAKVRQQLQKLRDLGLVAFLGGGRYRRALRSE